MKWKNKIKIKITANENIFFLNYNKISKESDK